MEYFYIGIASCLAYCTLGCGVYRLCKSSDLGRLSEIPPFLLFFWPFLLLICVFAEE